MLSAYKVWKVYVDKSVHESQRIQGFVATCVVNNGKMKPLCSSIQYCTCNKRRDVFWSNKIDIVNAIRLKLEAPIGQLLWSQILPLPRVRNGMILTEDAAKVTAREKD